MWMLAVVDGDESAVARNKQGGLDAGRHRVERRLGLGHPDQLAQPRRRLGFVRWVESPDVARRRALAGSLATQLAPYEDPEILATAGVDLAVVGGGILGLAAARELKTRHPGLDTVVLDSADRVGTGQTGHNSGVIHAGIYYAPGSLKARMCVAGARPMYELCERRGIAYERCGKLIVARDESELGRWTSSSGAAVENEVLGAAQARPSRRSPRWSRTASESPRSTPR